MAVWFDRLFPQAQVTPDNQVFAHEIKQVRGLRTPKSLLGYTLLLSYGLGVLAVGWYVVRDSNHTYAGTRLLLGILAVLAIGFALLSDINCTRIAVQSLKDQPADMNKHDLISARLALTQIKAWWLMGFEIAFRVAFFTILFICFLSLGYWSIGQEINQFSGPFPHILILSNQLATSPGAWGILLAAAILLVVQMLEPTWRLRTLAAMGLKRAAQNPNASVTTATPNIVILWAITLVVYVAPGLFLAFMLRNALLNSAAFGLVAYSLVVGVVLWGAFDWLETNALKQIEPVTPTVENPVVLPPVDNR